jgi:SAM-dependent methyltransferase
MLVGNSASGVVLRLPIRFRHAKPHADREFGFLERRFTPRTVFMEVGAARGGEMSELALWAAGYVERVYAVDVFGQLLHSVLVPCNLRLVLCDGVRIPVPEASVDVAWSGAFMDELHADDAGEHLQSVHRCLVPGGEYICVAADPGKMRQRFLEAGFSAVLCYLGAARIPWAIHPLVPRNLLRISALK